MQQRIPCQLAAQCALRVGWNALVRLMHLRGMCPIRTAAHCPLVPLLLAAQIRLANPTANGLGGRLELLFDGQWGTASAVLAVPAARFALLLYAFHVLQVFHKERSLCGMLCCATSTVSRCDGALPTCRFAATTALGVTAPPGAALPRPSAASLGSVASGDLWTPAPLGQAAAQSI